MEIDVLLGLQWGDEGKGKRRCGRGACSRRQCPSVEIRPDELRDKQEDSRPAALGHCSPQ